MKIETFLKRLIFVFMVLSFFSCKKEESAPAELSVSQSSIIFTADGGFQEVTVVCNANWSVTSPMSAWLELSKTSGESGSTVIRLTTLSKNESGATRSAIIIINSSNGEAKRVKVSQPPTLFPSYNTSPKPADVTGMSSSTIELAAKIRLGWNIGNTLEAPGGESGWGNPAITEDYIKFVKQQGFNAIRLPCAWDMTHLNDRTKAQIDPAWLARVKEVVGYCVKNDLYVLLNVHWDGGWLENNCTPIKKDSVNAKQKALWEQIATTLRDFDEHLMFASANEPNVSNAEEMKVLLSYHQSFIDAVRSTGGKNVYRTLVIQGSSDFISVNAFPVDPTPNRLMYEEHNYTPYQFTALEDDASWGNMFYYWGAQHHSTIEPSRNATWGEEDEQRKYFEKLKTNFVDKGIPVLMGEYGAFRRDDSNHLPKDLATHNDAIDYWITYVTKQALSHGVKPFYWDTGGVLDRQHYTVKDARTIKALIEGGK